jgi:hypothetical protein
MGNVNASSQAKKGSKHGGSETATPITKSPAGTPAVVDLYSDQLPPGGD